MESLTSTVWTRLVTDFDPDEETANFGTRLALHDREGAVYDVVTWATVEPNGPVTRAPEVTSLSTPSADRVAVAIDSCLHVVNADGEVGAQEEAVSLALAGSLDSLAWSPCGRFVLAALRSAKVQLLHVSTKRPLPAIQLDEVTPGKDPFFVHCQFVGSPDETTIRLISAYKGIYEISGVDLDSLGKALTNNDFGALKSLQEKMHVSPPSEALAPEKIICACHTENEVTIFATESAIGKACDPPLMLPTDYLPQSSSVHILRPTRVVANLLLCVDDSGAVHEICLCTFIVLRVWAKEEVLDLVLIEDEGDCNSFKMLMLVASEKEDSAVLQMREYPSFELIYQLEVNSFCHPLSCGVNHETPLFLEGCFDPDNSMVRSLRVRGICESVPEARLQRLVRRQRFEEAEKLAKVLNLPVESVYQAKATWLLDRLSPWRLDIPSEEETSTFIRDLKTTLLKIKDLDYLVRCCVTAALPTIPQIRSLLLLAKETIRNNVNKSMSVELMVQVSLSLQRLETFTLVWPEGSIDDWVRFSRSDIVSECESLLSSGQQRPALLVWERHRCDFQKVLDEKLVEKMLELIPKDRWTVEVRLNWLRKFVPSCLTLLPSSLGVICSWAQRACRDLEVGGRRRRQQQQRSWPSDGLALARGVLDALNNPVKFVQQLQQQMHHLSLAQQRSDFNSSMAGLVRLAECLQDLEVLHTQFSLKLRLRELESEDKRSVATSVLDWCEGEEVANVAEGFLKGYLEKFGLESGEVFKDYLINLITSSEFRWHWHVGAAPWESRACTLMPLISSRELQTEVVLLAAKSAPVPWTEEMQALVQGFLKVPEIAEQQRLVKLKQVMKKYGSSQLGLSGRRMEMLYQFMIKTKKQEGYHDALLVARASADGRLLDVHVIYVKHLLFVEQEDELSSEAVVILKGLENEQDFLEMGERLLIHCELEIKVRNLMLNETTLAFLTVFKQLMKEKKACQSQEQEEELAFRIEEIRRKLNLKKEFGLSDQLQSPREALSKFIEEEAGKVDDEEAAVHLYSRSQRLASLVGISNTVAIGEMVKVLSALDRLSLAAKVALCLSEETPPPTLELTELVLKTAGSFVTDETVMETISSIAASAVATCNSAILFRLVELCRWQRLLGNLQSRLSSRNRDEFALQQKDPLSGWRISDCYRDLGLPLDSAQVLPLFNKCFQHLFSAEMNSAGAKKFFDTVEKLCCTLKKNAYSELVLSLQFAARSALRSWFPIEENSHRLEISISIRDLLLKVLGERKPDLLLARGYLLSCDKRTGSQILKAADERIGLDYSKLRSLALLGMGFSRSWRKQGSLETFAKLRRRSAWGEKAKMYQVDFEAAFTGGKAEQDSALSTFLQHHTFSLVQLCEYCRCFELDVQPSLVSFVRVSLLRLEPTIVEGGEAVKGPEAFDTVTREVDLALRQLGKAGSLSLLSEMLLDELSPYNYEVLGFAAERILQLAVEEETQGAHADTASRFKRVLGFLLQYGKRHSTPGMREKELWTQYRRSPFPKLAEIRLPLTWMVTKVKMRDRFKLLEKEFLLHNTHWWCDVSHHIGVRVDHIRLSAVHNAVDASHNDTGNTWSLTPSRSTLLKEVSACVGAMSDPKVAVSCVHFFVNSLPDGADKVIAARKYSLVAQRWMEVDPENKEALQAFTMIQDILLNLEIEFTLRKYDLYSDERMKLVHERSAADLIEDLYQDKSIYERTLVPIGRFPDVESSVRELCSVADIELTALKFRLLDRWLPSGEEEALAGRGAESADLDETVSNFTLNFAAAGKRNRSGEEAADAVNLSRCIYLAQSGDEDVLNYLVTVGLSEHHSYTSSRKIRALECLLSSADDTHLQTCTSSLGSAALRRHLTLLRFVTRLAKLNLPLAEGASAACDVLEDPDKVTLIVESLLKGGGGSIEKVELVADLCLHTSSISPKVWTVLLKQMVQLNMTDRLRSTLLELNRLPQVWHFQEYEEAWRHLLKKPSSDRDECARTLEVLSCCPLALEDLNLDTLRAECKRLGLLEEERRLSTRNKVA